MFAAIAGRLHEAALISPDQENAGGSLLVGTSGMLLVAHRFSPSATTADTLADAACLTGEAGFPGIDDL